MTGPKGPSGRIDETGDVPPVDVDPASEVDTDATIPRVPMPADVRARYVLGSQLDAWWQLLDLEQRMAVHMLAVGASVPATLETTAEGGEVLRVPDVLTAGQHVEEELVEQLRRGAAMVIPNDAPALVSLTAGERLEAGDPVQLDRDGKVWRS